MKHLFLFYNRNRSIKDGDNINYELQLDQALYQLITSFKLLRRHPIIFV